MAVAAVPTLFVTAGPVVPETAALAVMIAAEKVPVMPVSVNREEYVQIVPPADPTDNIPRKLVYGQHMESSHLQMSTYYAFVPVPPVPTGTVTLTVLAAARDVEGTRLYNCCGAVFEPENRKRVYVVRSVIDGASPESCHVTVKAVPPATEAPAAGTVNSGYAKARGSDATRATSLFENRIVRVVFSICKASDLYDRGCSGVANRR